MAGMANLATLLKSAISRVARKEVRVETLGLKNAVSVHRAEIVALKKRVQALEVELRRLSKEQAKAAPGEAPAGANTFTNNVALAPGVSPVHLLGCRGFFGGRFLRDCDSQRSRDGQ